MDRWWTDQRIRPDLLDHATPTITSNCERSNFPLLPYIDPDRSQPSCYVGLANDPYLALLIAIAIVSNLWDFVVQVPRNR